MRDEGTAMRLGLARCAGAAVLFGAAVPISSRLVDRTGAPLLAGLLYLGAALAVIPVAGRRTVILHSLRRGGRGLGVAVVAGGLVGPLLLANGLSRTSAATASLLLNAELVATALIARFAFREHLGARVLGGIALVVTAGATLTWGGTPELRTGALLVIGACACWGLDNAVTARLDQVPPAHVTLAKGAIAGTTNVVIAAVAGAPVPELWVLPAALVTGAVGYGASITLWISGARQLGAARAQLVFSLAPFVGAVLAWTVLHERASGAQVVALALALAGAGLVVRSGHEHPHLHSALEHDHEHDHDAHHAHEHDAEVVGPHTHAHRHAELRHAHPHVPDLHHGHHHDDQ